jgi:hypothetical protein
MTGVCERDRTAHETAPALTNPTPIATKSLRRFSHTSGDVTAESGNSHG